MLSASHITKAEPQAKLELAAIAEWVPLVQGSVEHLGLADAGAHSKKAETTAKKMC